MPVRTKINPPNDFEMVMIDLPAKTEDLDALSFPKNLYVWVQNPQAQVEALLSQALRDFDDVQSFVKTHMESGQVKLIRISYQEGDAYFVCFGADPDELENSISFRIDQAWDDFSFPADFNEDAVAYLKSITGLSGAVIGRLDFPEIILPQRWLGRPETCYGYDATGKIVTAKSTRLAMQDYFVLAQDDWGVATLLHKSGVIWLWNTTNWQQFEVKSTGMSLKDWLQTELRDPFRQRPEPTWVRPKAQNSAGWAGASSVLGISRLQFLLLVTAAVVLLILLSPAMLRLLR